MESRRSHPIWLWMHLLSLDAPLIALIWQDFLARCYSTPLTIAGRCVLGLTVWVIYIADRMLDVRGPSTGNEPRHHRFYRAHRRTFVLLLTTLVVINILVIVEWLRPQVFIHGLVVAGLSLAYLAAFTGAGSRRTIWKKSAAAMLFSAGVCVVASTSNAHPIVLPWFSFAVLLGGNLALIELWKRCRTTSWARYAMPVFALLCAAFGRSPWYIAVALSAVALAAVSRCESKVPPEARRVLADLALFTPLLLR
jgi:hypothetical protein